MVAQVNGLKIENSTSLQIPDTGRSRRWAPRLDWCETDSDIGSEGGLVLPTESATANVEFAALLVGPEGSSVRPLARLPGQATLFGDKYRLEGWFPQSPLGFKMTVGPSVHGGQIQFLLDLAKWEGRHLSDLPLFDNLVALCSEIELGGRLVIEAWSDRGRFLRAKAKPAAIAFFSTLRDALAVIAKARAVGRAAGRDPRFVASLSDHQIASLEVLFCLIHGREYVESVAGRRVGFSVGTEIARKMQSDPAIAAAEVPMQIREPSYLFDFLDEQINLRQVTFSFTHMRLASKPIDTSPAAGGPGDVTEIEFVGGAASELVIRAQGVSEERSKRSIASLLKESSGGRLFRTSGEVDEYLRGERSSWDR